jgi:hypothetical protein
MRIHTSTSMPAAAAQRSSARAGFTAAMDHYDHALISIEHEYPSLNPDSCEFDEELMFEVYRCLKQHVLDGIAPARALLLATSQVIGRSSLH